MRGKVVSHTAKAALAIAFSVFLAAAPAFAQDSESLDDLFADDIIESPGAAGAGSSGPGAAATDPVSAALKSEAVRVGGSYAGDAGLSWTWNNPWNGGFDPLAPDTSTISAKPSATVFFDARPDEDYRVHGSFKTAWPFRTSVEATRYTVGGTTSYAATPSSFDVPDIRVFELFADVAAGDRLFFRFGKSTIAWGVGYFWSPADVLNLQSIDLFDPEAQREGPVNLRVHFPVPGTMANLYGYAVFDPEDVDFDTTALAAKAEVAFAGYEAGVGAWYRQDTAERAMVTLSGSAGNFQLFGEAALSRGSAKTFATAITGLPPAYATTTTTADHRENWYFSGTAGFMYLNSSDNITAIGQYFYNGEGYADADRDSLINQAKAIIAAAANPATTAIMKGTLARFLYGSGRHYAAISLTKSELFTDDFSVSLLAMANLSDGSGIVRPSLSWKAADRLSLGFSPMFVFGGENAEYALLAQGPAMTLSLTAKLGSGSF